MLEIFLHLVLLLLLPLFVLGVIQKAKAIFAGRTGAPLLQPYWEVGKLLRKGAVYSRTTTWVFRAGPLMSLTTALAAGLLVPLHSASAPLGFEGDVILLAYVLGLGRFFTMAAALDTGSSFEGMGASREAAFSALAEPALFLALAIVCVPAGSASFTEAWHLLPSATQLSTHPAILAAALALFAVLLTESSRIPVDDPATHLELTMIHEVMVLDHGGPDLAMVQLGSAVKLLVLSSLLIHLLLPVSLNGGWSGAGLFVGGAISAGLVIGLVESLMARLRLVSVPQFLVGSTVLAAIGLLVTLVGGSR
jgi:formate hydrogenlyase subunit 4